ncbi:gluconokinase [Fulvimonas soli]|jgi:gluconokinase|uniref:Gluconokinase n=1 Tax=Fulvimonas soli TaxID=155197 RepID=A0A316IGQ3_9GAMM|nr:gluconokinase [Fulvimonas soli]PWK92501.1 gluconokinase [Fulvimonas soli]
MVVVVMGVSGAGKSTFGAALAQALGWDFQEGDALHPPANVAKMCAGIPLDDADRAPWLARVAGWIADHAQRRRPGVISCSALKRAYRDYLRAAAPGWRLVYLRAPRAELLRRVREREHFMPVSLLDSQLQTLEEPSMDEHALVLDATLPVAALVERAIRAGGRES